MTRIPHAQRLDIQTGTVISSQDRSAHQHVVIKASKKQILGVKQFGNCKISPINIAYLYELKWLNPVTPPAPYIALTQKKNGHHRGS